MYTSESVSGLCRVVTFLIVGSLLISCATVQRIQNSKYYYYDVSSIPESQRTQFDGRIKVSHARNTCFLVFFGGITNDSPRAFRLAADDMDTRPCNEKIVVLDSIGGNVEAAIKMGYAIRLRGYTTSSAVGGGSCRSACGLMFIGGVKRIMYESIFSADIGFHQMTYAKDGKKVCVPSTSEMSRIIKLYSEEMLPPKAASLFYELSVSTNCNGMRTVSATKMIDVGIATGSGMGFEVLF